MKDITIVTAFFDINRKNINGFNRSNEKYIESFKFWAHLKNNLIVFSDKETIDKVLEIREEYGLLEKTKTIIIDNYLDIDKELFNSIDNTMKSKEFLEFHLQRNIPEAISSKYNYIMALKSWCCASTLEKGLVKEDDMLLWLDFGFNYGGKFYRDESDFDILFEHNFSDKIHLFQVNKLDDLPAFEIIRRNNSYIQGGEIVAPANLFKELWNLVRSNMISLNKAGLADDDQILYLMSYRQKKELFELHDCEWLGLFKDFSNHKFNFKKPVKSRKEKILDFLHKCKHPTEFILIRKINYAYRTFRLLKDEKIKE